MLVYMPHERVWDGQGGSMDGYKNSRELQCFYASCDQCTDSFIFMGPGLSAHRRNHGKQREAFLQWKFQLHVDNTSIFSHCLERKVDAFSIAVRHFETIHSLYKHRQSPHGYTFNTLQVFDHRKHQISPTSVVTTLEMEKNVVFVR